MIEEWFRLLCNKCGKPYHYAPVKGDIEGSRPAGPLLRQAEEEGWKVYRLASDIYYGSAWCRSCRPDRCERCKGRGYYPKFPLDPYYGEPQKVDCEVCDGFGFHRPVFDRPDVAGEEV